MTTKFSCFLISIFYLLLTAGSMFAQSPGTYTDLHNFGGTATEANGTTGPDGFDPLATVRFDSVGNMYGVAGDGGADGGGTVWEITASGTYKDLHDFGGTVTNANGTSGPDGTNPNGVTLDSAGNIYGMAIDGGPNSANGDYATAGMVWEITANGAYRDLHDFGGTIINANGTSSADGENPVASVTLDTAGNIYGTTIGGGANLHYGIVWEITASGTYKDLHDFGGTVINANGASGADGILPAASVTFDTAGNMYGTSYEGGAGREGIVWEITSAGTYKDLHDFGLPVGSTNGVTVFDGIYPAAGVTFDKAGNMFGTTFEGGGLYGSVDGMVWEITSSGTYTKLHGFGGSVTNADGTAGPDGYTPNAAVTFDSDGNMFGTTIYGGPNGGGGIVWEITASGTYRDLHDFGVTVTNAGGTAGPDGFAPYAAVTFDKAGNLIGTTSKGGPYYVRATSYDPGDYGGILWKLAPSPSAPTDLTATAATGGVAPIRLSWNAVSGAIVYRVYRSTVSNGEANPALVGGLGTPGYTDTSAVTAGSTYYYKVTAVNTNGASPFSNEAAVTLTAAAPAGLTATAAAGGVNPVTLAWTASTGATSYNLYRGTALIGSTSTIGFSDSGAAAGVANSYTVTVVNAGGTSPASNTATVTLSPATPSTLTATAGSKQVILNWSASAGAIVYRVYRSTTSGGEANPALAGGIATTTYTDTGAVNGATYYYEVTAVNTAGASPFSTQVSATPGSGAPLAPTLETVTTAAGGVAPITLTWTASAGALVYRVYRSTVSNSEANPALAGGLTTVAYTDAGALTAGARYYYEITAVNTGGASPFSNEKSATLTPAPPVGLTAAAATGGVAPVALAWTASAGATGYNVYRGTAEIGSVTAPTVGFSDAAVIPAGVGVSYTVTAVDAGGTSAASAAATVLLRPAAPLNLIATASSHQVVLNWTASAGAVVYRVYRSTTSNGEANPALAGGIAATTYTDTTVVSGTFYYYTVTAVDTAGASGFSNECDAPTGPVEAPPLLTATTAAGGLAPITLSWAAVPGAAFYRVYRGTTSNGEGNPALAVGVTSPAYTDTAVSAGITYYYKVTAVDNIGASGFTNEASATLTPAIPIDVAATAVAGPAVDLTWSPSVGATSYNVYRGLASGQETLLTTVSGPAYTDTSVNPGTTYFYYVEALNTGGTSAYSNEAQVLTE